nr:MAG TPA: hypothetical protein [Caudoviricetes sp.]
MTHYFAIMSTLFLLFRSYFSWHLTSIIDRTL